MPKKRFLANLELVSLHRLSSRARCNLQYCGKQHGIRYKKQRFQPYLCHSKHGIYKSLWQNTAGQEMYCNSHQHKNDRYQYNFYEYRPIYPYQNFFTPFFWTSAPKIQYWSALVKMAITLVVDVKIFCCSSSFSNEFQCCLKHTLTLAKVLAKQLLKSSIKYKKKSFIFQTTVVALHSLRA